jgi:hypothetical protein
VIDSFDRGELADFIVPVVVEAKEVSDDIMVAKAGFSEHRVGVHSCVAWNSGFVPEDRSYVDMLKVGEGGTSDLCLCFAFMYICSFQTIL